MKDDTFKIVFGEDRRTRNTIIKTYFFNHNPLTKVETSAAFIQGKIYTRNFGDSTIREIVSEYYNRGGVVLKMFSSLQSFGKPRIFVTYYIKLDPNAHEINITGLRGFGSFRGRGEVYGDIDLKELIKPLPDITNGHGIKYEVLNYPKKTEAERKNKRLLIIQEEEQNEPNSKIKSKHKS